MNEASGSTMDAAWEAASPRFETPRREQEKSTRRLRSPGVETWERWLDQPQPVLAALRNVVEPQILRIAWGKLMLVGTRRGGTHPPAAPL